MNIMPKYNELQQRLLDSGNLEVRAIEEEGKKIIEGYALTYNTRSKLLYNSFYEIIEPGAFDDVLRSEDLDVVYTFNHSRDIVMGRTKNNTLSLRSDEKGLFFRAMLPDTSDARDMFTLIKEGYVTENSFAFMPAKDGYSQKRLDDGTDLVTIKKVDKLQDVSSVVRPAYPNTSVKARADEEGEEKEVEETVVVNKAKLSNLIKEINSLIEIEEEVVVEDAVEEKSEDSKPDKNKKKKFLKLN